jgi:HSP90 family molecular chaperone
VGPGGGVRCVQGHEQLMDWFGVGLYSVCLVADRVELFARHMERSSQRASAEEGGRQVCTGQLLIGQLVLA